MRLFQDYSRIDRVYPLSVVSNGLLAGPLSHDSLDQVVYPFGIGTKSEVCFEAAKRGDDFIPRGCVSLPLVSKWYTPVLIVQTAATPSAYGMVRRGSGDADFDKFLEDLTFWASKTHNAPAFCDHAINPSAFVEAAAQHGYAVSNLLVEVMVGRWVNEYYGTPLDDLDARMVRGHREQKPTWEERYKDLAERFEQVRNENLRLKDRR